MSDLIPQEIMVDILQRLRAKDLVICRNVSKQWMSIIDDPHFIRSQLRRSLSTNANSALFIQDMKSPGKVVYWNRQRHAATSSSNLFSSDPVYYEPNQELVLMGSCHGLVCFSLLSYPHDFIVLNPSTGERHTLSNHTKEDQGRSSPCVQLKAYGFGYDELSDDYKLVRILETRPGGDIIAEIHSVRSKDFYRTIPLPAGHWATSGTNLIGVFFGNSLHWCNFDNCNRRVIHAIDLMSNTYRQLQFPDLVFQYTCLFFFLNVGVVDGRLCFCGLHRTTGEICMWVMEEYGNPKSWSDLYCLSYRVDIGLSFTPVVCVGNDGNKILFMVKWRGFLRYDPTTKILETDVATVPVHYSSSRCEAIYCLESLVQIFPKNRTLVF